MYDGLALGLVREHRPGLAVVRALDLVPVVDPVPLPDDADAGQVLGLAEIDLPPLRRGVDVGAPSGRVVAVDGRLRPMLGALRRGGRRRLPLREVFRDQVGRWLQVVVVELVDRPEQAAGDEVEIARIRDGRVVVAERRAEDLRLAVIGIGPGHDPLGLELIAAGRAHARWARACPRRCCRAPR